MVNHDLRDAKIKALHASGLSGAAIGRPAGLTRERVRQIVSGKQQPKPPPKTRIVQRRAAAFGRLDALAEQYGDGLSTSAYWCWEIRAREWFARGALQRASAMWRRRIVLQLCESRLQVTRRFRPIAGAGEVMLRGSAGDARMLRWWIQHRPGAGVYLIRSAAQSRN